MTDALTYLDWNAGAPVRPEAEAAALHAMRVGGNASSIHRAGRLARRLIEEARAQVATLAGADPADVIFCGSGTEANALALHGVVAAGLVTRVAVGATEHDSVLETLRDLGCEMVVLPVDGSGGLDLEALARVAAPGTLVSVMAANNEVGTLQDLGAIVALAHGAGALVHSDAIQAAGKVPLAFETLDIDLMTLSAHKLGGLSGCGALVKKAGLGLVPRVRGGGQERGFRAGTENLAGIAAFGAAAAAAVAGLAAVPAIAALRDALEARALAAMPQAQVVGAGTSRLANTSVIAVPGVASETQVIALDLGGVAVSAGSACSSGKVKRSRVLDAMGYGADVAGSALRISLGHATTAADVDRFIAVWSEFHGRAAKAAAENGRRAHG
ncbi:cysteine desulfurase family protein [Zavarzinia sp. CC-PAN008]|uniref:cysteine desulfurase family protein n=1 Tax=Zavarzinia sp. CC-PAN008 TaxID=3243332 RepID=UPI003F7448A8